MTTQRITDTRSYRERQLAEMRKVERVELRKAGMLPRTGPPPKPAELKLSERVTILLTRGEREALDAAAHDGRMNVNQYIRSLLITKLVLDGFVKDA